MRVSVGVSVLTCSDSSKAGCVCCPVRAAAEAARLWLLLPWMERPGSGAPSAPDPTDTFNWHEKKKKKKSRLPHWSSRFLLVLTAGVIKTNFLPVTDLVNTTAQKEIAVSFFLYSGRDK